MITRAESDGADGPRLWRVLGAVGLLVGAVAMGGAPRAGASSGAPTTTETFYPWTSHGQLRQGLRVAASVRGTCWTGSIAVSASDAYRCVTTSDDIHDPCFAPPGKDFRVLACLVAPWDEVTRFVLTAPLAPSARHVSGRPQVWAMTLHGGARCVLDTGTAVAVAGRNLNFYCTPGEGWASFPATTTRSWTVRYAASSHSTSLVARRVLTAWY